MKELHELLNLCLEKGFTFEIKPHIKYVEVYKITKNQRNFYKSSYYQGDFKNHTDKHTVLLSELIKIIKDYEVK